jgi:hypothetical protein
VSTLRVRLLQAVLPGLLAGCGEKLAPYEPERLPSGRTIKMQSYHPEDLFTGEEALLLKFVPEAALDDAAGLDAEVAAVWKDIMQDAQKRPGTKLVLIRAIAATTRGWDEGGQVQYVYRLQPDGTWSMQKDPEVRLR